MIRSFPVSGRSSPTLHPPSSVLQRPIKSGWTREAPTALRDANKTKQVSWHSESTQASGKNRELSTTLGLFSPKFESVFNDSWGEVKAQMRFSLMVQLHVANNAVAVPRVPLWRLLLGKASITVRTISAGRWAAASDWYNDHIRQLDYLLCGDS